MENDFGGVSALTNDLPEDFSVNIVPVDNAFEATFSNVIGDFNSSHTFTDTNNFDQYYVPNESNNVNESNNKNAAQASDDIDLNFDIPAFDLGNNDWDY